MSENERDQEAENWWSWHEEERSVESLRVPL